MYSSIYGKVAPRLQPRASGGGGFASLIDRLLTWQERARSRRMLRELDDRMLHDIGIDRSVAEREGAMPFWR
jgi:uncharacterized protein YjiS (DUF1127 family)